MTSFPTPKPTPVAGTSYEVTFRAHDHARTQTRKGTFERTLVDSKVGPIHFFRPVRGATFHAVRAHLVSLTEIAQ